MYIMSNILFLRQLTVTANPHPKANGNTADARAAAARL
jgi:hypothetical protein